MAGAADHALPAITCCMQLMAKSSASVAAQCAHLTMHAWRPTLRRCCARQHAAAPMLLQRHQQQRWRACRATAPGTRTCMRHREASAVMHSGMHAWQDTCLCGWSVSSRVLTDSNKGERLEVGAALRNPCSNRTVCRSPDPDLWPAATPTPLPFTLSPPSSADCSLILLPTPPSPSQAVPACSWLV